MTLLLRLDRLLATLAAFTLLSPAAWAQDRDHVNMDLDEFLRLYDQSRTPTPEPAVPPYDHALTHLSLQAEVILEEGRPLSVAFKGKAHVEVLADRSWVSLPILPVSAALRSIRAGGKELAVTNDGMWHQILLDRRQGLDLDLDFVLPLSESQGTVSLGMDLPAWASTELSLAVPSGDSLDFTVAGAASVRERIDGVRRVVDATIPPGQGLWVSWQRALPQQEAGRARLQAEAWTLATLGDGLLSAQTTISWSIQQAAVEGFDLRVPEGIAVVDVLGTGLRRWQLAADRTLHVDLNFQAEGSYSMTLQLETEAPADGARREIPVVRPLGVERTKGWAAVVARGAVEVKPLDISGAVQVDVRSLPGSLTGATDQPILFGWKYLGDSVSLPFSATAHRDVAVLVTLLDEARATTMVTREGRRLTSVRYLVRNNGRQFLRAKLPAGATLWSAQVGGAAVQPGAGVDGAVLLPLLRSQENEGTLASFAVDLVYVEDGAPADTRGRLWVDAALPETDVPITWVGWSLWLPDGARLVKRGTTGSMRRVTTLSTPWNAEEIAQIQTVSTGNEARFQQDVEGQLGADAMGQGTLPVEVRVPLRGTPIHWERLLALGDGLRVGFAVRGLR